MRSKGNHDPKAWQGIFVGYQDQQSIGWRIFLPNSNEFIVTAHASFEDHRVGNSIGVGSKEKLDRYTVEELRSVNVDRNVALVHEQEGSIGASA